MRLLQEFKEFAVRGNVIDLAVGVIIGSAFGKIVDATVKDLLMPVLGTLTGDLDFSNKFIRLSSIPADFKGNPDSYADLTQAGIAVLGYGSFITAVLNFLMLAFVVFVIVKQFNRFRKEEPAASEDILLLREIRDNLKK